MVKRREEKNGQHGFTLIEIIAVLVILGILAVVAIPKYLDLQKQAAANAVQGGVAALGSQVSMDYANAIMVNPNAASTWAVTTTGLTVGDFVGGYTAANGSATVQVTGGANAQGSNVFSLASGAANFNTFVSRTLQLYTAAGSGS